jgi:tetratricopeptide (TPR) repeat protein
MMKWLPVPPLLLGVILLWGCGRPTAEELFAKAQKEQKAAEAAADTTRSVEAMRTLFSAPLATYTTIVDEYPKSDFVEPSLFMIGTIRNNNTHEYQLAVDAYKRYVELFPDGKQVQLAMFLIGYLYNNELHNLDSAGAAYRRFLDRYPDSEMAASARFELNTLGKSPDELLPPPGGKSVASEEPKPHAKRKR